MTTVAARRRRLRAVATIAVMLLRPLPLVGMAIDPAGRRRIGAKDRSGAAAVQVLVPALASVAAAVPSAPRSVLPPRRRRSGAVRQVRRAADRRGAVRVAAATGVHKRADTSSAALHAKRNLPARALLRAAVIGVHTLAAMRREVRLTVLVVLASAVTAGAVPPIAVPRPVGVTASVITPLVGTAASTSTPIGAGTVSVVHIAVSGTITPRAVDITAVMVRATTSAIAVPAVGATAPTTLTIPPIGAGMVIRHSDAVMVGLSVTSVTATAVSPITADAADTAITALAVAVLSSTDAAMSPASIAGKGAAASLAITA